MKKIIGYILSAFFILFTVFGLLGLIVSHDSASDIVIECVWTIVGAIFLYLSLKLIKAQNNKKSAKKRTAERDGLKYQSNASQTKSKYHRAKTWHPDKTVHELIMNSVQDNKQKGRFNVDIPKRKYNVPLAYQYNRQQILDLNYDFAIECAQNNEWELSVNIEDDNVALYSGIKRIGVLGGNHVEMLKDWIKSKEPYTIILEGISSENKKAIVYIAFYRDKREKMSYRERTTVRLTNCRKEDQQMIISSLENGDELYLSESYNDRTDSEYVGVEESGIEIGRLPKNICNRYFNEGAAGCFFDHSDYDEEKDIHTPYVTIYW